MSDKKNIERLFQEKFKDFEAVPQPEVWDRIEAELKKKKKRRAIPLWLKLSGTAAILLIGLLISEGKFNSFQSTSPEKEVVNGDDTNEKDNSKGSIPATEQVVVTEKSSESDQADRVTKTPTVGATKTELARQENDASEEKNNADVLNTKRNKAKNYNKNNQLAASENKGAKNKKEAERSEPYLTNNPSIATQENKSQVAHIEDSNSKINTSEKNSTTILKDKNDVNAAVKNNTNSQIAFDTVAFENQKKDSATIAAAEPNALEELLKEKEKETVTEAKLKRWQITSNVAPIFFSSASNGSPIDERFADNSKDYESNLSYGIGVNYALSKNWSVKGGVNKLALGYNTNDIVYYSGLNTSARAVATGYEAKGSSIIIEDNVAANMLSFDNIPGKTPGYINQTMGFIEVPVELSYKLLDRKFGIEIVGGMSTLFLNENNLSVVSSGMRATLGKASNLNDISFSSNVGLGFKYRFWKSFEANVEPKFKYQLNTFTENTNGFKPYFIGIYSGINFNF